MLSDQVYKNVHTRSAEGYLRLHSSLSPKEELLITNKAVFFREKKIAGMALEH
jgi:hypothetical protein